MLIPVAQELGMCILQKLPESSMRPGQKLHKGEVRSKRCS